MSVSYEATDRNREQIACTGMPEAPGTRREAAHLADRIGAYT